MCLSLHADDIVERAESEQKNKKIKKTDLTSVDVVKMTRQWSMSS